MFWSCRLECQKRLGRRYRTIPLPHGFRHKKNKKTWKIRINNNKECSIVFNKTCINNNSLRRYTLLYILFNPVNLEEGIIPIRINKIFENRISNLNNPGEALNANKNHWENNLKKTNQPTKQTIGHNWSTH